MDLGLHDAIDVVYGSSAGCLVGAYFVSEQFPYVGPEVYYNELCSAPGRKSFINRAALLKYMGLGALRLHTEVMKIFRQKFVPYQLLYP